MLESQPLQALAPVQVWAPGQVWHSSPPVPHDAAVSPARQLPLAEQQPSGQLVGLQVQAPLTHAWPA